ncbi:complex I subunit 5 family protein [Thiocystis violascens]|uniref:Formate hydrogenlyase subunit 3/multisubunit Na+/H+ antiporter, MnhD subunit n=1 Tax=Thiocystis violascens (strain ATCC 17096 / DSM 198 / 6111) TaxID=765911 RepID=I3Y8R8_THIV6|nr:proton-conducting transporter membrane subunit [Thiocystis violascens]AFL73386.1 formate hydrogenlyase subunit 3/multisubunit Na+/H+ antiporter, MnhD subunit [Thiocystis violascens DSM 198]
MDSPSILVAPFASLIELGGLLLVIPLMLPVVGLLLAPLLGGRFLGRFILLLLLLGLVAAVAVATAVLTGGDALQYHLGGWAPPLGVALKSDGLSAILLLVSAVVMLAVGIYAQREFQVPPDAPETRASLVFWMLLMGVWAGLNAAFLGQDLFTLFVALELLTFSAVPLVALDGRTETLAAALRYLLFALLGSVLYLLGAVLFYGTYATLDIALLAERIAGAESLPPPIIAAAALMTVGLLAKTALFPLHLWLPPAHAGAPPPASAILSALVVKASFFLIVRIWFDVLPGALNPMTAQTLGALGAGAILFGNLVALRQARLKLLIAYSTVAQIGYLFLIFPLAASAESLALTGGMLQVVSHACAKAAMFMAAGLIAGALGHDRIRNLGGSVRVLPITLLAFGLAGLSLIGLQPSGGYLTKTLLTAGADGTGQWWWGLVMQAGGLLTAAYLFWVLGHALFGPPSSQVVARPGRAQELVVLALALAALLLGLLPPTLFDLVGVGRTGLDASAAVATAMAGAFGWRKVWGDVWPILVVGLLVLGMLPWPDRQADASGRLAATTASVTGHWTAALGAILERADRGLRQWPVAGLLLLILTLGLAGTLLTGD